MIFKRKSRYLLVEASGPLGTSDKDLAHLLGSEIAKYVGEQIYTNANPYVMAQLDNKNFVLRVGRGTERQVTLALAFVKKFNDREIGFYTLKTSGTMRSIKEYFRSL